MPTTSTVVTPPRPNHAKYDLTSIHRAAAGQWPAILTALAGIPVDILDGRHHPCPKCGGHDRFRLIDEIAGALHCNQCFRERNGDGISAIQWALGIDFPAAVAAVADHLNLPPEPRRRRGTKQSTNPAAAPGDKTADTATNGHAQTPAGRTLADPAEHLDFRPWNDDLAALWCLAKPPITPAALFSAHARRAVYRREFPVLALPVWGEDAITAARNHVPISEIETKHPPVGWALYHLSGGTLPKWAKSNGKPKAEQVKIKLTHGSQPGFIGPIERFALGPNHAENGTGDPGQQPPAEFWKVEGASDLLALLSCPDFPEHFIAVTNANGCGEKPAPWMIDAAIGFRIFVCHDADKPGQHGAIGYTNDRGEFRPGWCQRLATAGECRNVQLPFPISDTHGNDLRDFLTLPPAGRTFADLQSLADPAPIVGHVIDPAADLEPLEAADDPHRLARVNLSAYNAHAPGARLVYWRGEWYSYKTARGHYRRIEVAELQAKITTSVKREFDRLNRQALAEYRKREKAGQLTDAEAADGPPSTRKVTLNLLRNVLAATQAICLVPSSTELRTWLVPPPEPHEPHGHYIAFANGILDLDRLLRGEAETLDEVLLPHSAEWFSLNRLPYPFELDATCPQWLSYLDSSLEADADRIAILQEWAGYLLLPDTSHQRFLALEGEGANGKSVYFAGLIAMLGLENCSAVSIEQLSDKFARTQTLGKLANICPDVGEIQAVNEGDLKAFVSGDTIFFDRKYLTGITCPPTARLMISYNRRPRITDRSDGVWRRILPIPFLRRIPEAERVLGMDKPAFWEASSELPGMLLWALAGLHRLRQNRRFSDSDLSATALADYREDANPARAFLLEHLELTNSQSACIRCSSLYQHYRRWIESNGYRPLGERSFGKEVAGTFPAITRRRIGPKNDRFWAYQGLAYTTEEICGEPIREATLF